MRLNAYLARAGVASRRGADELIKAGRVRVNGQPGELNTFVGAGDAVEVDGRPVAKQGLAYLLLHKPAGTVTTARDPHGPADGRRASSPPSRGSFRSAGSTPTRPGALLLTNDGPLAHRLAHPRYEVDKVYEAEVEGDPGADALRRLAEGVDLDDGRTAPARARRLGAGPHRADDPRGPQAPGEADVRGGRPPGAPPAPQPLRGAGPPRPRAGRVARAHPRRGRGAAHARRLATRRT